jgi:hypothetical protein
MSSESAPAAVAEPIRIPRASRSRADPLRLAAARSSLRALALSRLLVWTAGVGTILAGGYGPVRDALNPPGTVRGFGPVGDLLAAPAARWDASWYLVIAHYGYRPQLGPFTSARDAFFPLYPLAMRLVADLGPGPVVAGVLVSLAALGGALYGVHRLTTLELGSGPEGVRAAGLAVALLAFAPMAFFLSAVYSESLYLALSVAVFWCARHGRWGPAAALAALAAATRSAGVVLLLPVAILYLYGPREDRPCEIPARGGLPSERMRRLGLGHRGRSLRPRYRVRRDALWLALVPAGLGAYMAYLGLAGGDPLMPLHAQQAWGRRFAGPFVGAWDGAVAAFDGARQLISGQSHHVYFAPLGGNSAMVAAGHNVLDFAFLALALPALVATLRRLPLAYGAYVVAALALALSYPVAAQPLMSLPRFLLVLFPLTIALAAWLVARPGAARLTLGASAVALGALGAEFATWHWVA